MNIKEKVKQALPYAEEYHRRERAIQPVVGFKFGRTAFKMMVATAFLWGLFEVLSEELTYIFGYYPIFDFRPPTLVYIILAISVLVFDIIRCSTRAKITRETNKRLWRELEILERKLDEITGFPPDHQTYDALSRFHYFLTHGIATTYEDCARLYYQEYETDRLIGAGF